MLLLSNVQPQKSMAGLNCTDISTRMFVILLDPKLSCHCRTCSASGECMSRGECSEGYSGENCMLYDIMKSHDEIEPRIVASNNKNINCTGLVCVVSKIICKQQNFISLREHRSLKLRPMKQTTQEEQLITYLNSDWLIHFSAETM